MGRHDEGGAADHGGWGGAMTYEDAIRDAAADKADGDILAYWTDMLPGGARVTCISQAFR